LLYSTQPFSGLIPVHTKTETTKNRDESSKKGAESTYRHYASTPQLPRTSGTSTPPGAIAHGIVSRAKKNRTECYRKRKVDRHNHAVSPGRARPVVVAVLGSLLFQERYV
jgi:hypothetical protein